MSKTKQKYSKNDVDRVPTPTSEKKEARRKSRRESRTYLNQIGDNYDSFLPDENEDYFDYEN